MAFKRVVAPKELLFGSELTEAMIGIGMNFSGRKAKNANIEDTLLAASQEGIERADYRVLAVLVTWIDVHYKWINADRLIRLVENSSKRIRAFWASVAIWKSNDSRFTRLAKLYDGRRVTLLSTGTTYLVKKNGEDDRFKGTALRVPANTLRDRKQDVATPSSLAQIHDGFRHRVLMGPTYRADMWANLENTPSLSTADLARSAYGSFATAWQVKKDWQLLNAR